MKTFLTITTAIFFTAFIVGPSSYLWGYRTAQYDYPKTINVQVQWPQATNESVDEAVGSAKRVGQ